MATKHTVFHIDNPDERRILNDVSIKSIDYVPAYYVDVNLQLRLEYKTVRIKLKTLNHFSNQFVTYSTLTKKIMNKVIYPFTYGWLTIRGNIDIESFINDELVKLFTIYEKEHPYEPL